MQEKQKEWTQTFMVHSSSRVGTSRHMQHVDASSSSPHFSFLHVVVAAVVGGGSVDAPLEDDGLGMTVAFLFLLRPTALSLFPDFLASGNGGGGPLQQFV